MKLLVLLSLALALVLVASGKHRHPSVNKLSPRHATKASGEENNDQNEEEPQTRENAPEEGKEGDESDKDSDVVQAPRDSEEEKAEQEAEEHVSDEFFEGDIMLTENQRKALKAAMNLNKKEAITGSDSYLSKGIGTKWPEGRIPYTVAKNFDESRKATLKKAIAEYNKKTCIKFEPKKSSDEHWIKFIIDDKKCYSYVGKVFLKNQPISIGNGCNFVGTFVHEMMHAVGFFHEQSRLDRDDYVEIIEENIDVERFGKVSHNFAKYDVGQAETLGEPYDYESIMHYPNTAFGKRDSRGRYMNTIISKKDPDMQLGQRDEFSDGDVKQINMLYNCTEFL